MSWVPGVKNPAYWTKRQRHLALNQILKYDMHSPIFQYMRVNESQAVQEYKRVFTGQVRGKIPFNPETLLELLKAIGAQMGTASQAFAENEKEEADATPSKSS